VAEPAADDDQAPEDEPGDEFHFNWPAGNYAPGEIEQFADGIRKELE